MLKLRRRRCCTVKSLDPNGRSLEEVVEELTNIYYPVPKEKTTLKEENKFLQELLQRRKDKAFVARVLIQRLKGEMCKYLTRSVKYAKQIEYIKKKIKEIEEQYPEVKIDGV